MTTTRKAVRIIWTDASGGGDCTLDFIAPSTAEAVCMMIDHMEAAGLDMETIETFAIVAKAGPGAAAMMAADEDAFIRQQSRRAFIAATQSCAA